MKSRTLTATALALLLTIAAAASASAQNARLQMDHLDKLFPKASETIDVTVDKSLLTLAAKFLKTDKPDEAAAREIISALKGVYVKGVQFESDNQFAEADVETLRSQLRAPGWSRIVGVRSKREGQNVDVYLMINNGVIDGIGVLLQQPKQLMVVNVVGTIDPEKIYPIAGPVRYPERFRPRLRRRALEQERGEIRKTERTRKHAKKRETDERLTAG